MFIKKEAIPDEILFDTAFPTLAISEPIVNPAYFLLAGEADQISAVRFFQKEKTGIDLFWICDIV